MGSGSTCVEELAEVNGVVVGDVDGVGDVELSFCSPTIVVGGLERYAPPTKMGVTSASVTGTSSWSSDVSTVTGSSLASWTSS